MHEDLIVALIFDRLHPQQNSVDLTREILLICGFPPTYNLAPVVVDVNYDATFDSNDDCNTVADAVVNKRQQLRVLSRNSPSFLAGKPPPLTGCCVTSIFH